ncbi:MAG: hypothetical protein ACI86H_002672, partial [bacterium]
VNPLEPAYFVRENDLENYDRNTEQVFQKDGSFKCYPKGDFIYRLSGRDRQRSASYYTPEELTQCLVKYSLKELLKDKTADQILKLTVCEPAMGSGAFLNEAINQLAEAYLQQKEKETKITVDLEKRSKEKQKIKAYLATNNVFGVDLNPVAVELGEVSLWLNTIYQNSHVPWLGMQIVAGNSLIGARKQIFPDQIFQDDLETKKTKKGILKGGWLDKEPERFKLKKTVDQEPHYKGIYHFLLPDEGMATYSDKVIKALAPDQIKKINDWKKEFCIALTREDYQLLKEFSLEIDRLWEIHVKSQQEIWKKTRDSFSLFQKKIGNQKQHFLETHQKDEILYNSLYSDETKNSSAYLRLKLVMNYWSALWFWPIEKADLLPTRSEFLSDLNKILKGGLYSVKGDDEEINMFDFVDVVEVKHEEKKEVIYEVDEPQQDFLNEDEQIGFEVKESPKKTKEEEEKEKEEALKKLGYINLTDLCLAEPRLKLVTELGEKYRFHHWELQFAWIFQERGGFDLIVGNPPWIKLEWQEGGLMGEYNPLFDLRNISASKLSELRKETFQKFPIRSAYFEEYEEYTGSKNFLSATQNYSLLKGSKSNLYKCFLPQSWMIGNRTSVTGLIHPEGVYDDPNGGKLREELYPKLKYHFQFQNEKNLFAEVDHHAKYSINCYSNKKSKQKSSIEFQNIANLFSVSTIDQSINHQGNQLVGGIKDDQNQWNIKGHQERVLTIQKEQLDVFCKLYDSVGTPIKQARLSAIHSQGLLSVLKKFANYPQKLGNFQGEYFSSQMWNETNAQKGNIILRKTRFPSTSLDWILSGPHFYVGNPLNKTPRKICTDKLDYDRLDLTVLKNNYLPRTNYVPDDSNILKDESISKQEHTQQVQKEYLAKVLPFSWNDDDDKMEKTTNYYRICFRAMLSPPNERALISAIIPKKSGHIHGCRSYVFRENKPSRILMFSGLSFSIPFDFMVKSTGRSNLHQMLDDFPFVEGTKFDEKIKIRVLLLNCLTTHYSQLWEECWTEEFQQDSWAKEDSRLGKDKFSNLGKKWTRETALRTDFERRHALVEIDVLTALALGLTLDELCTIYRIQFPVLRQYESDTWYDQNGRTIFTSKKGEGGLTRKEFEAVKDLEAEKTVEQVILDSTQSNDEPIERTITYVAPFTKCDREEDYRSIWDKLEAKQEKVVN